MLSEFTLNIYIFKKEYADFIVIDVEKQHGRRCERDGNHASAHTFSMSERPLLL